MENYSIKSVSCSRQFVWRITDSIRQSALIETFFIFLFIILNNISLFHPVTTVSNILHKCISGSVIFYFIAQIILVFAVGVIYGKEYVTEGVKLMNISRFAMFMKLFKTHNIGKCIVTVLLGFTSFILCVTVTEGFYPNSTTPCLNGGRLNCLVEERYFYILAGPFCGVYFFLRHYFADNFIRFPVIQQKIFVQVKSSLKVIAKDSFSDALSVSLYYILFYFVFGGYVNSYLQFILDVGVGDTPLHKIYKLLNPFLIIHLLKFSFVFLFTMNFVKKMFVINLTQILQFPIDENDAPENGITLKDAFKSEQPILRSLAFQDLFYLSENQPDRRIQIFSISIPGGHGHNWKNISEQCLNLINKFIADIHKLSTDANLSKAADVRYNRRNLVNELKLKRTADLYNCYPLTENSEQEVLQKNILIKLKEKLFSNYIINYIFGDVNYNSLKVITTESQNIVWATRSLANLLSVSLTEDRYGVTQVDFEKVVTTIIKLRQSLNILNLVIMNYNKGNQKNFEGRIKLSIETNVRSCLYLISESFKPYFQSLSLSDETRRHLNSFSLWNEG